MSDAAGGRGVWGEKLPRSCARAAGTGVPPSLAPPALCRRRGGWDRAGWCRLTQGLGAPAPCPAVPWAIPVRWQPGRAGSARRSLRERSQLLPGASRAAEPGPGRSSALGAPLRARVLQTHAMRWLEAASLKFFRVFGEKEALCCCPDNALRHIVRFLVLCTGPGVAVGDPNGSLPTRRSL